MVGSLFVNYLVRQHGHIKTNSILREQLPLGPIKQMSGSPRPQKGAETSKMGDEQAYLLNDGFI